MSMSRQKVFWCGFAAGWGLGIVTLLIVVWIVI